MKRIDELGVSRRPWELMDDGLTVVTKLDEDVYGVVAECRESADARLIAAAPELYECLCEAVENMEEVDCDPDGCSACSSSFDCVIPKFRAALAKAAGEEGAK